ncbi:hypothetical protein IB244_31075 [Rhizobium sp. RHZ02]|uniref:hypothetical protein n=1 Tax=Rhizobium sp. RHZ02 TaxID=2769306 RepID=UPI00177F6F27|nr:hypothetical protein [Rhizobium sp. RHZ02]MBD9455915.1 hypothetical protein [Rhizobium sp. RHZ02]
MIDHCERQRAIVAKDRLQLVQDNVSQEAFIMGLARRSWPVGSRYFYALQGVYSPRGTQAQQEANQ